ncbi:MAG: biotin-dependent carboxyltransferase family protein [Luteimonas sp.]
MSVHVLAPGLLSSVQDTGRHGFRHLGVGTAGAMDAYSHAIANLLVGNPVHAPALEITMAGPRLRVENASRIALCGADITARCEGHDLPGWRTIDLPAGSELTLGNCRRGARAYLAIAGGFAVSSSLGSFSADLRGGFGGLAGRALVSRDVLPVGHSTIAADAIRIAPWWIDPAPDLDFASPAIIRMLPGRDATSPSDAVFAREWRVAAASNRQGLRLEGNAVQPASAHDGISEPVGPGTVQLPPDGRPIVLLADAQTHGGYPRIGHAIVADHPRLAQLRPGDALRFVPCTAQQARRLRCEQQQRLARIAFAISQRLRGA